MNAGTRTITSQDTIFGENGDDPCFEIEVGNQSNATDPLLIQAKGLQQSHEWITLVAGASIPLGRRESDGKMITQVIAKSTGTAKAIWAVRSR